MNKTYIKRTGKSFNFHFISLQQALYHIFWPCSTPFGPASHLSASFTVLITLRITIQEIISDTPKFEKLVEDPTLKREASLQDFLLKLKQKIFFNENEYDKLYPSGSAPARIYGTPKMQKFSSSD